MPDLAFDALKLLDGMRPRRPSRNPRGIELSSRRATLYALIISVALVAIMLVFVAVHVWARPLPVRRELAL
jgi:hypothetical protein